MHLYKKNFGQTGKNFTREVKVNVMLVGSRVQLKLSRLTSVLDSPGSDQLNTSKLSHPGDWASPADYSTLKTSISGHLHAILLVYQHYLSFAFPYWKILRSEFNISGWMEANQP